MNPDDFAPDDVATDDVAPADIAPDKPRSDASLEAALAKHANRAMERGADPKAVSDLLTSHIRYARGNPVERQNAERALNEGADADAVTSLFFQRMAADPLAQLHIDAQSGKLARVIAAQNAAGAGAAQDAAAADTYGSRFGKLMERKVGILAGNTPATLLTMGARRLAGSPISRQDAAQEVARDVEEAGQNEPGVNLPFGMGRVTMTDVPTAMLGYNAVGRKLGLNPAAVGELAKIGAVYEGGKRLIAPEEESGTRRVLGTAGHAALGYFTPRIIEGAGSLVQNIGQRTGATDFLGSLAKKVGFNALAENIGTKGAVNDLLRVRQRIIDALGVTAETADQYLDAMVKRGQTATAPAYATAKEAASTVEAAPAKAANRMAVMERQAGQKALPAPGQSAVAKAGLANDLADVVATQDHTPETIYKMTRGQRGLGRTRDVLEDVARVLESDPALSVEEALTSAMDTDAARDAQYAGKHIIRAARMLGVPESRAAEMLKFDFEPLPRVTGTPKTLEQAAAFDFTAPNKPFPTAAEQPIQSTRPGEANYRELNYTKPRPVKLQAANDVNVRRPATPEAVPAPSSTAPNIPAIVEQAHAEAFAHPQVQRYLKQLYRETPELRGQTGYDVADQLKRDMNRDWGTLKPADRAGEYGGSLRDAKGLVQDYLDALSQGKAGTANAVHRAEVAVPREFFVRGSKLNVTPKGRALETNSPAALENDIARLPPELQDIARNAARAGRAADVAQGVRAKELPASAEELLRGKELTLAKIRPAFKTQAEFEQFVAQLAKMRGSAASQARRMGPQTTGLRSFYKPQNPLATERGIIARTNADANPLASPAAGLPLESLWNAARLTGGGATQSPSKRR